MRTLRYGRYAEDRRVRHPRTGPAGGRRPGETLLTINGHPIVDVLDYRFYGYDPVLAHSH